PGYLFGLEQESFTPLRTEPVGFTTDAEGKATIEAYTDQTPDTSHPLEASVRVAVFDLGGRPIYRRITLPVALQPYHIGIRPLFENGSVGEGATAGFDVIAVDRAGEDVGAQDLGYAVLSEDYDYVWYRSGGQWYAEWVVRERVVETGDVAVAPGEPGRIEFKPDWGMYRVEVFDDDAGVASSVRFSGGWWTDPTADRPDEVEVSLDKESYKPGETAKAFIKPPFGARVLVTVADSELRWSKTLDLPADGGFVEIPVSDQWTAGTYVIANAYPTDPATKEMLPRRAVGVDWLALDQGHKTLTVAMTLPEKIRPSQRLEVPLTIAGAAAGEEVHLTLAAVDDAVLQLTGYTAPDPLDYFLGKRALDVLLHDVYGYLIRSDGDVVAGLRTGGDMEGRNLESLPERSSKVVSLYSGIVEVGTDGQATVSFDVPDFNGRLRVMGVAWSKTRLGSAEGTVIVRAPLIAEMTLPRFLAPGDEAKVTVALRNLDGSAGDYKITIATDGVVSVDNAVIDAKGLAVGKEARESRTLKAETLGVATITLSVSGPEGYALVREKRISVRPASPRIQERLVASLPAGQGVTLTQDLVAAYYLPSASASLSLSTVPDYDVPGLLDSLYRYPYGCAEQTVSTALPLLYVNDVAVAIGLEDDAALAARVQEAVYRLMNMQLGYGAFGLWGPWSDGEFWLTAYVTDFLTRAMEQGYHVPEAGYSKALDYLESQTNGYLDTSSAVAGYAYAQYVLARAGMGDLSELRYFYETRWQDLPTPLSRAQFSAALAWLGDLERARSGFGDLTPQIYDAGYRAVGDYGSDLRDKAAAVTLMSESGAMDDRTIVQLADQLGRDFTARRWLSTQEMSWLLLATHALSERAGEIKLSVDGTPYGPSKEPFYARVDFSQGEGPLGVVNNSKGQLYEVVTIDGVPIEPLPAEENGFTIRRRIFDLNGHPVALSKIQQGQNYLVLIEGRSHDGNDHDALVVDLLPAGFEIENANLGQGVPLEAFPWLGELSWTQATEARDDRFAAALKLNYSRQGFRVAYMVRAVTPGSFVLPAVFVEDMYTPELNARGTPAQMVISGR
ncbi:MAG TPA: alpha-2-macroglobulin family protein, partial [Kiloniellales bacterium]|nr:alpha-2-macroglobulin family protein [Kiloniellales bacterium]